MVFQVDTETISIVAILGLLLVLVILVLVLSRKFSKKALRRWLMEKEDRTQKSDKVFNTLIAVKTISKNFEGKGMDVNPVKPLIEDAESEMELKNYSAALDLAEQAKKTLIELKVKKDKEEREGVEPKTDMIDAEDLKPSQLEGYEPTTKEMLQKKFPPNYFQAKFTIGIVEEKLKASSAMDDTVREAKDLLEKGKRCFESEDFDGALKYSTQCKRLLEGERVEVSTTIPRLKEKLQCPRCKYEAMENDVFCRRCGHKLKE